MCLVCQSFYKIILSSSVNSHKKNEIDNEINDFQKKYICSARFDKPFLRYHNIEFFLRNYCKRHILTK